MRLPSSASHFTCKPWKSTKFTLALVYWRKLRNQVQVEGKFIFIRLNL